MLSSLIDSRPAPVVVHEVLDGVRQLDRLVPVDQDADVRIDVPPPQHPPRHLQPLRERVEIPARDLQVPLQSGDVLIVPPHVTQVMPARAFALPACGVPILGVHSIPSRGRCPDPSSGHRPSHYIGCYSHGQDEFRPDSSAGIMANVWSVSPPKSYLFFAPGTADTGCPTTLKP